MINKVEVHFELYFFLFQESASPWIISTAITITGNPHFRIKLHVVIIFSLIILFFLGIMSALYKLIYHKLKKMQCSKPVKYKPLNMLSAVEVEMQQINL